MVIGSPLWSVGHCDGPGIAQRQFCNGSRSRVERTSFYQDIWAQSRPSTRRGDMSFSRHHQEADRIYPESPTASRRQLLSQPQAGHRPLQMYPLVSELSDDGIPVTVTCRVLKLVRQDYYRWLAAPITASEIEEAYLANALFDACQRPPRRSRVRLSLLGRRGARQRLWGMRTHGVEGLLAKR